MMEQAITLISSVGFPIAAAAYMAYLNSKQTESFNEQLDKLNQRHESEVGSLTEAINNNSKVITILTERIGHAGD